MPNTPRLNLPYPLAEDPPDGPTQIGALASQLDSLTASDGQGTLAARPAPGTRGRFYFATDLGQLFRDNGSAWLPVPYSPAVTSLPSSPADGQEVNYVANDALGAIWRLRYRAASASAYKWEFLGGSPLHGIATASFGVTTANVSTYIDVTNGPTVAVPLAGEYWAQWYGSVQLSGAALGDCRVGLFNQANTQLVGGVVYVTGATQFMAWSPSRRDLVGVSAGNTVKLRAASNNITFTLSAGPMWRIELVPVRVG